MRRKEKEKLREKEKEREKRVPGPLKAGGNPELNIHKMAPQTDKTIFSASNSDLLDVEGDFSTVEIKKSWKNKTIVNTMILSPLSFISVNSFASPMAVYSDYVKRQASMKPELRETPLKSGPRQEIDAVFSIEAFAVPSKTNDAIYINVHLVQQANSGRPSVKITLMAIEFDFLVKTTYEYVKVCIMGAWVHFWLQNIHLYVRACVCIVIVLILCYFVLGRSSYHSNKRSCGVASREQERTVSSLRGDESSPLANDANRGKKSTEDGGISHLDDRPRVWRIRIHAERRNTAVVPSREW